MHETARASAAGRTSRGSAASRARSPCDASFARIDVDACRAAAELQERTRRLVEQRASRSSLSSPSHTASAVAATVKNVRSAAGFGEAGRRFFDGAAEIGEALRRRLADRAHLGIDAARSRGRATTRRGAPSRRRRLHRGTSRGSRTPRTDRSGSWPAITSSASAASATVRVIGPRCVIVVQPPGLRGTRPYVGLDAEDAAERRRDADRAAAVAAQRDRAEARGHRGRRAAARAAGRPRRGPTGCSSRRRCGSRSSG